MATHDPARYRCLAAVLFALDVDLQQYGATMLPEALTVTLTVAMVSLRLRDGTWRRAAWLLAALGLVRPNFVVFPLAFAGLDALRLRRVRAVLAPLLPTAVVLAAWSAVALTSGADPARPLRWFVPMHTFGTYDVGRLAIAFHPFDAMCWACASGALAHRLVTGRGAETPPSHAPSSHTRPTTSLKV